MKFKICRLFLNWNKQIFSTNKPIQICMRMITNKTYWINGIIMVSLRIDQNAVNGPISFFWSKKTYKDEPYSWDLSVYMQNQVVLLP